MQAMVGGAVAARQKSAAEAVYVALWETFAAALAVLQRQHLVALCVLARLTPAQRHGHAWFNLYGPWQRMLHRAQFVLAVTEFGWAHSGYVVFGCN